MTRTSNRSPAARGGTRRERPALRFAGIFLGGIAVFSVILRIGAVNDHFVVPVTGLLATASGALLNLMGMATHVSGTLLQGDSGFAVNILNGCNGMYVSAILVSAVLAFPCTWKERLQGLLLGIVAIQVINLVRIVSLYYIGLNHPDLFDQFHLYIWQTGVIIVSMGVWLFWAEALVGRKGRRQTASSR